jgi:DNA-binding NarL/FixJ family response regulator
MPDLGHPCRGDAVIPFEEGRKVAALIPNAAFLPLEGQNHLLLATDAAWPQFAAAITDFLRVDAAQPEGLSMDDFTPREREVLGLLAQGLDNRLIASKLRISEKTVRNHVSTLFSKLNVGTRAQAIVVAREGGLGRQVSLN